MEIKRRLKIKNKVIFKTVIIIFFIVIMLLFIATYFIYSNNRKIDYYNKNNEYGYIIITQMSEKFAIINNKELHFVKDKNKDLFVIAIPKNKVNEYKQIIDWTYKKNNIKLNKKVYVYPVKNNEKIMELSIKNVNNFLCLVDQIEINKENYSKYLGFYYLNSDVKTKYKFNYIVFILFLILLILIMFLLQYIMKNKQNMTKSVK